MFLKLSKFNILNLNIYKFNFITLFMLRLFILNKIFNFNTLLLKSVNNLICILKKQNVNFLVFLKKSNLFKTEMLTDILCNDLLFIKNTKRFQIIYVFTSLFNLKIRYMSYIYLNLYESINSIGFLYEGADWLEREIWDMYGIFFFKHNDLRRILLDYGFKGFPLRKEYPLSGFFEVRFDDIDSRVIKEPVEFSQEYRFFQLEENWGYIGV